MIKADFFLISKGGVMRPSCRMDSNRSLTSVRVVMRNVSSCEFIRANAIDRN
jgi:hypothetical protein